MKAICFSLFIFTIFSVSSFGQVAAISGHSTICSGTTDTYTDATTGGTWSASPSSVLTISTTGITTTHDTGTAIITYTVGSHSATKNVTVNVTPGRITGPTTLCSELTVHYTDSVAGGVFFASSTIIAVVTGSGGATVTAFDSGTAVVSYTIGSCSATLPITIYPQPASIVAPLGMCELDCATLTDPDSGGHWSCGSLALATIDSISGFLWTDTTAGLATITYTLPTGCYTTHELSIDPQPGPIIGPRGICWTATGAYYYSDTVAGGRWFSFTTFPLIYGSGVLIATLSPAPDTINLWYAIGYCPTYATIIVYAAAAPISGDSVLCVGTNITLSDSAIGGHWSSTAPGFAAIAGSSGVVTGMATGTSLISYNIDTGCYATKTITVYPRPDTVTASYVTGICRGSGLDSLIAHDSATVNYSWLPSTGLSCATCRATSLRAVSGIYTVTATDAHRCKSSATVGIDSNKIEGHVVFDSTAPTALEVKVWLIRFNSTDSSIIAVDSMLTCIPVGATNAGFEFVDMPAGKYMLTAKLLSSIPDSGGYYPIYGASKPYWDSANTINHTLGTDSMVISMKYASMASGPGIIGGHIVKGAGSADSSDAGILVFLEDTSYHVLNYTYTDASGNYSFSGLPFGKFIVYPTDYHYYTTPSAYITLTVFAYHQNSIDFKQHTSLRTITPYAFPTITTQNTDYKTMSVFPNPTTGAINIAWQNQSLTDAWLSVKDMLGREVFWSSLNNVATSGIKQFDLSSLKNGVYFISIRSADLNYSEILQIEQ